MSSQTDLSILSLGIPSQLPNHPGLSTDVPHAPKRNIQCLSREERKLAVKNALRYFPQEWHSTLAPEFYDELIKYGHIYMYRFRPTQYRMKAYPFSAYPGKSTRARCIMLQIMNNLDPDVAQYPEELVTYGGNGSVFSNWIQYLLVMKYLSEMTDEQTLILYSGHPMGLFPSQKDSPVCIISNGMMIPNYSNEEDYTKYYALGTTQFGQMTAGSFVYIGSQGIVHGTTITIKNAGRKYLGLEDLSGRVYVTSGLGGMSGAQPKAAELCGIISVTAEVSLDAIKKRHSQGWVKEIISNLDQLVERVREARKNKEVTSIAFHGNAVDMWERFAQEEEFLVDLGSDQTSCHIPFTGGYYPSGLSYEESNRMMAEQPEKFKDHVQKSLLRHIEAIRKLTERGTRFWDYGNSFLLRCFESGADIKNKDSKSPQEFIYPSYVEDIMGDVFSLGFGPFRHICTSGDPLDLRETDRISAEVIQELMKNCSEESKQQYSDNLLWITKAEENRLVVGSQARILYSDTQGRIALALAFNKAIREGKIRGPIVLSRDHHDVSGADSCFRETANIYDGSNRTADMAVHTVIGNAMRNASWVALHNGGGTGWGKAINCGFALVLDGSDIAAQSAQEMLFWDVTNGLARRQWSGHPYAKQSVKREMEQNHQLQITMSNDCAEELLEKLVE